MLQTHALAAELLAGADELPGHATQLALSAAEYLPTLQSVQVVAPGAAEDVPAPHVWHEHVVSAVRSTPCIMASAIAVVAA